jgi:hypothetical protein
MTVRGWTQGLVALLALTEAIIGGWATFGPSRFYQDGPIPGADTGWVALFPPYNEHLVRDYGTMSLALAVVLGYAAVRLTPSLVRMSMVAMLVFAVPHTTFHMVHLEHFAPAAAIGQSVSLIATVVIPLVVIVLAGRLRRARVQV